MPAITTTPSTFAFAAGVPSPSSATMDNPPANSSLPAFAETLRAAQTPWTPPVKAPPPKPAKPVAKTREGDSPSTKNHDHATDAADEQTAAHAPATAEAAATDTDSDESAKPVKKKDAPQPADDAAAEAAAAAQAALAARPPLPAPPVEKVPLPSAKDSASAGDRAAAQVGGKPAPPALPQNPMPQEKLPAAETPPETFAAIQPQPAPPPAAPPIAKPKVHPDEPSSDTDVGALAQSPTDPGLAQLPPDIAALVNAAPTAAPSATFAKPGREEHKDPAANSDPAPAVLPPVAQKSADPALTSANAAAAAAQDSPRGDNDGTFDQIVMGLRSKFDSRAGKAEISLEPPNLGKLHVSISLENGALTAHFRAANESVRDLLNSNLDKLKATLESQGVAVDKLAVNASPDTPSQGGSTSGNNLGGSGAEGRSAGEYSREGSGQSSREDRRRPEASAFAKLWKKTQADPIDVVA